MDIDTRAPSPASDTIEETADPPWAAGNSNPTASPQSSSERDQSDVTCNLAALAGLAGNAASAGSGASAGAVARVPGAPASAAPVPMVVPTRLPPPLLNPQAAAAPAAPAPAQQPAPTGVHVCSNCNVPQPSTSMSIHPSPPSAPASSGSPSLLASIGRRPAQTHSMSPSLLPAIPQRSSPSPPPGDLEQEVRYLRSRLKDLETLSARLHGQLESSQQRLFKERAHHETIAEMLATRVGVLEGDNQKLRARLGLGDKVPDMGSGIMGEGRLSLGTPKGHTRRTSKDVNAKKRSPSSDPRRGTPPRHIDIDPPSLSSLSAGSTTTPKATTPRCQDVCPVQCSQQLVVGQEQP